MHLLKRLKNNNIRIYCSMMVQIAQLNSTDADFQQSLDKLLAFENAQDDAIDVTVAKILAD